MTRLLSRTASLLLIALAAMGCTATGTTGDSAAALSGDDGGVCEPTVLRLMAGQHMEAGSVEVSNTETHLVIDVTTTDGWAMSEYHAYAGPGPIPLNRSGAPQIGHFPYKGTFDPASTSLTLNIPLDELQAACGDELVVAFHAVVGRDNGDGTTDSQTAWGEGDDENDRAWGSAFTFDICCDDSDSCVMPKYIWRDHQDWWQADSVVLGGVTYDAAGMYSLLWTPGWGDASVLIAHQVIGAELNIAAGAVPTQGVLDALAAAEAWLLANADADGTIPYLVHEINPAHAEGVAIASYLQAWNEGEAELPLCKWW